MSRLRVGLIGCGSIARSAHIPAIRQLDTLAQLVAVCDVRADVAEQTATALGIDDWTTDYRHIVEHGHIDAVILATPEYAHLEQTTAAARAGKHILCEKPISVTLDEADCMIRETAAAGVKLMVGHSRRFTARYLAVRQLLDADTIGEPVLIRENERRPRAQYAALGLPVEEWQPEPGRAGSWKGMVQYSDGVARGHAIHEMDLFRWFAGSEAQSVYAESKIVAIGREVPDMMSIQIQFRSGVLAGCDLYTEAPSGYPYYHQLEIIGTRGIIRARDTDMMTLTRYDASGMHHPVAYESLLHIDDAYVNEQRQFFEAILNGTSTPLDPWDARAALELALAAAQSANSGSQVNLPFVQPTH